MPEGLHCLVQPEDFKALLGVDDREDCLDFASVRNQGHEFLHGKNSTHLFQPPSLAAFCLVTATYTIEQYCKRKLLLRKNTDYLTFTGEYIFSLREYPVREIISMNREQLIINNEEANRRGELGISNEELGLVGAEFYRVIPDCGDLEDIPYCLSVSPALRLMRGTGLKVHYWAGYAPGEVPPDLASACLELAAWNMSRYRGKRIGVTGAEGEHLEASMPENVRQLLEPYKRRMI